MSVRSARLRRFSAAVLVAIGTAHSEAILFSDLGSATNPYYRGSGWVVSGPLDPVGGVYATLGFAFSPSQTAQLTRIDVALSNGDYGENSGRLTLQSDIGGLPGEILYSWDLYGLPTSPTTGFPLEMVTPNSPIELVSGQQYWLTMSAIATRSLVNWSGNSTGATGPMSVRRLPDGTSNVTIQTLGAFDVIGTAVPEPGNFVLVSAGLALCCVARIWRK
jgi:hypothetical protein